MPVLMEMRQQAARERPLAGQRIAGCLHVTKETAVLIGTLEAAGAEVSWSGCNPLSTQNDIAAALAANGTSIYAWHGMGKEDFYACIDRTLSIQPTLTLDDGADLIMSVHQRHPHLANGILGGTEETTTGVHRLRVMASAGKLLYPVLAINDARTKCEFDNVYGTGQSSVDGVLRATNILIAGKTWVTAGYGHCGRGCAMRAAGMGATSVVTEIDPQAALRATLEGHRVVPMDEAASIGDIFITATGMKDVICRRHFEAMRDGAVVCNTGHYDCEIDVAALAGLAAKHRTLRENCEEYTLADGRRIYLLAQGRLVNLAAAEGHPSEVMDMSFANQYLGMVRMAQEGRALGAGVHPITDAQDQRVAAVKLKTSGIRIDRLTAAQSAYADNFLEGT